ncbi:unnamed protein product [Adineta ricciae]|uniref:Uncharacterized protein n=1 Tax=Adineta ricciae TaxID=249248 RepID=A0A813SJ58_ADIRI|nr:unnamed protein product [Adineta ricciae]CAF1349628.1 unnamed protein product [Adineta ricciae]
MAKLKSVSTCKSRNIMKNCHVRASNLTNRKRLFKKRKPIRRSIRCKCQPSSLPEESQCEDVSLVICLNDKPDENVMIKLRCIIDNIHVFADGSQCIHFLDTSAAQGKVYVIVSESFGEQVVSCLHDQSFVDAILIFRDSNRRSLRWINKWSKIHGAFSELSTICATLKKITRQNDISISTFSANVHDPTTKIWNREKPSMIYTQILKETLLSIDFQKEHTEDFMKYCNEIFSDNKLEWNYRSKTSIWWYSWNSFPYRLLNSALREMNLDLIIHMGFFINDLHQHIQQLYSQQFGEGKCIESFTVYHGQKLSKADFDRMTKNKNDFISFNSFLSTSKDHQSTLRLAQNFIMDSNFVAVLFVMTINPNQPTTPFASTAEISENQEEEDEILFSMNPIFRVEEVKLLDRRKRLYQINVTLAAHGDSTFCQLTHHITRETCADDNPWHRLGSLLITMGEYYNAERIYRNLLDSAIDDREKGYVSNARGWLKYNQGKYKEALKLYKSSLILYKKVLPSDHPDFAIVYNNMGIVCNLLEDYSTALFAHKTALKIRQQLYEPNYLALYMSYSNLGDLYQKMGDRTKSLMYFERGLEIIWKILPHNDPDIATLLANIGKIYYELDNYEKALLFQKRALKIWRQSNSCHPYSLAACYGHIGFIYKAMNEPRQALLAFNKSLKTTKCIISLNHPMLADLNYNAGLLYYRMGKYPKAYTLFQNAVDIGRQSLSSKHSYLRDYRKYLKLVKRHL